MAAKKNTRESVTAEAAAAAPGPDTAPPAGQIPAEHPDRFILETERALRAVVARMEGPDTGNTAPECTGAAELMKRMFRERPRTAMGAAAIIRTFLSPHVGLAGPTITNDGSELAALQGVLGLLETLPVEAGINLPILATFLFATEEPIRKVGEAVGLLAHLVASPNEMDPGDLGVVRRDLAAASDELAKRWADYHRTYQVLRGMTATEVVVMGVRVGQAERECAPARAPQPPAERESVTAEPAAAPPRPDTAPPPGPIPADHPDRLILAAEAEARAALADIRAAEASGTLSDETLDTLGDRQDAADDVVFETKPRTLAGAAAVLRRIMCPHVGMGSGTISMQWPGAVRNVLDFIQAESAARGSAVVRAPDDRALYEIGEELDSLCYALGALELGVHHLAERSRDVQSSGLQYLMMHVSSMAENLAAAVNRRETRFNVFGTRLNVGDLSGILDGDDAAREPEEVAAE